MTVTSVLNELKALGDPRAIAVWKKLGMDTGRYYGANLTKLKAYAAKVKKNHDLANQLWATGIHDARLLAAMIADPKQMTEADLDRWIAESDYWDLTDKSCQLVAVKMPCAFHKAAEWTKSRNEFVQRSGFVLLAALAKSDKTLPDSDFLPYLDRIEREIQTSENWAKDGMNTALISIGARSATLKKRALEVIDSVGPIVVDYGDTSCQTPDARKYLSALGKPRA